MRSRRLTSLSIVAIAALALVGCSANNADPSPSATSSTGLASNICDQVYKPGDAASAVKVEGALDKAPTVTLDSSKKVEGDLQRAVAVQGDGAKLETGMYFQYAVTVFDKDGKQTSDRGHDGYGSAELMTAESGAGEIFGCEKAGSRIVVAQPASAQGGEQFYVFDLLSVTPGDKWCVVNDKPGTLPTVTMAADGTSTIKIPASTEAPKEIELDVLKEGTGDTVKPGANVNVTYTGVKWSDGSQFDAGTTDFATDKVVLGFTRALEGQKVGAEVLVVVPPQCGYAGSGNDLAAETLVFALKINSIAPTKAWGKDQPAVEGMPKVTLADNGAPTVSIPATDPPTEVKLATLKKGDGAEVKPGDTVTVQYLGVKWSDGTTFDSSWQRGEPASFPTTGVVDGFRQALEGHTVGSQILVVIPPKWGYGGQAGHALEKETLVFVVDILSTKAGS